MVELLSASPSVCVGTGVRESDGRPSRAVGSCIQATARILQLMGHDDAQAPGVVVLPGLQLRGDAVLSVRRDTRVDSSGLDARRRPFASDTRQDGQQRRAFLRTQRLCWGMMILHGKIRPSCATPAGAPNAAPARRRSSQ